MKKKFLIFLLGLISTVCLCIGLAACGNDGGSSDSKTSDTVAEASTKSDEEDSGGYLVYTLNANGTYTVTANGRIAGELVIPSTYNDIAVTEIGDRAFSGSRSLTAVSLPESITTIGEAAFSGCYSLTSVNIPESVTSIGASAFHYCTSLTEIFIPENISSIDTETFNNCTSLTSVIV